MLGAAAAQGVTDKISPNGAAPAGCQATFDGSFEISVLDVTVAKREVIKKRSACETDGILVATLKGGVIVDAKDRTGYIASNFQFQFDGPPQAGAIYTSGFSVCGNGSIALGSSAVFYKCQSGSFYNLYDRSWASQCSPVEITVLPCGGADPPEDASQRGDGQVVGTTVRATTVVIPLSDGQPQVITTVVPVPLCQISDGQLQAHTTPCASITKAAGPTTTAIPVSQYSDGQIQVTPASGTPPPPPATGSVATGSAVAPTGTASVLSPTSSFVSKTAAASPPAATTSKTAVSGAGSLEMRSLAALAVGVLGAVMFL